MARLDDKDKNYTDEERKELFLKRLSKINEDIKVILNPEKYNMHTENFNKILRSVYRRCNWKWDRD